MTEIALSRLKMAAEEISERARLLKIRTDALRLDFSKIKTEPKRSDKRQHNGRAIRRLR